MGFFENIDKTTINLALIIIGILILIYCLVPHMVNMRVMQTQLDDCRQEVIQLRKIVMKLMINNVKK